MGYQFRYSNNTDELRLDPLEVERLQQHYRTPFSALTSDELSRLLFNLKPEEKEEDMSFTNPAARELARELLTDKSKRDLREVVEAAIDNLSALVADTDCDSTLTFMKTNDEGQHYFYAAVKNGDKWYTTAQAPRILEDDDALIEWLIGLEIWEAPQLEVTPPSHRHELSNPIETTADD